MQQGLFIYLFKKARLYSRKKNLNGQGVYFENLWTKVIFFCLVHMVDKVVVPQL